MGRQVAALGEGGEGRAEPLTEGRRMDAASQITKLGDRFHGAPMRGVNQLQGPFEVRLGGAGDAATEAFSSETQLHHDGDHLGLGPIMEILFDGAQPCRGVVNGVGPGPLQVTDPMDIPLSFEPLGIEGPVPAWHQICEREDGSGDRENRVPQYCPKAQKTEPRSTSRPRRRSG